MPQMLIAKNVCYTYPKTGRGIFPPGASLTAEAGKLTLLVGESGSGKSTLLACLAGVLVSQSGEISIDRRIVATKAVPGWTPTRMLVLQNSALFEKLPIWQNVALAWGWPSVKLRARAVNHLTVLGLGELADQLPSQISLGQRQRAAIASAAACDPQVLLADEPTGALDAGNSDRVIGLLRQVASQGRIVIIASHDERLIKVADETVTL
ncbi:MAG: ATP-binding cassette domain-containing protein [Propionibacteriaceae bacterium]|nr:ATP-binding cassette domain-containing protein [Propionibacteriaceae bacterium]